MVEMSRKLPIHWFSLKKKVGRDLSRVWWKCMFHPSGFFEGYDFGHLSIGSSGNSVDSVDFVH